MQSAKILIYSYWALRISYEEIITRYFFKFQIAELHIIMHMLHFS